MDTGIFHSEFKLTPFWWEAYQPQSLPELVLPKDVAVAVIGGLVTSTLLSLIVIPAAYTVIDDLAKFRFSR